MASKKGGMKKTLVSIGLLLVALLAGALYKGKVLETASKVGLKDLDKKVGENAGSATA